jgi:hypothetical protein
MDIMSLVHLGCNLTAVVSALGLSYAICDRFGITTATIGCYLGGIALFAVLLSRLAGSSSVIDELRPFLLLAGVIGFVLSLHKGVSTGVVQGLLNIREENFKQTRQALAQTRPALARMPLAWLANSLNTRP